MEHRRRQKLHRHRRRRSPSRRPPIALGRNATAHREKLDANVTEYLGMGTIPEHSRQGTPNIGSREQGSSNLFQISKSEIF